MKYRVKFGDWNTAERVHQTGEIIELTEEQAAGFPDKLELVNDGAAVSETETASETVVIKKKKS